MILTPKESIIELLLILPIYSSSEKAIFTILMHYLVDTFLQDIKDGALVMSIIVNVSYIIHWTNRSERIIGIEIQYVPICDRKFKSPPHNN
jgi:hypothetical protein